jgi:hypothetical protein
MLVIKNRVIYAISNLPLITGFLMKEKKFSDQLDPPPLSL